MDICVKFTHKICKCEKFFFNLRKIHTPRITPHEYQRNTLARDFFLPSPQGNIFPFHTPFLEFVQPVWDVLQSP